MTNRSLYHIPQGFFPTQHGIIANEHGAIFDPFTNTISFPQSKLPATVARPMAAPVSSSFNFDINAPAFKPSSIEYPDPFANDAFRAAVFPTPALPASEQPWAPWNQGIDWSTLWKREAPQISSITRSSIEQEQTAEPSLSSLSPSDRSTQNISLITETATHSTEVDTQQTQSTITPTQTSACDQSTSPIKKTVTAITVASATITVKNFNKNDDGSYTAVFDDYSLRGLFNAQGTLLDDQKVKINHKNGKTITHFYEGPVTVIDSQIVPHGAGKITKGNSTITAEFVEGKILGDATIRNGNREYTGLVESSFAPKGQVTLQDDHCKLTGEFDSQLKLWGKGSVVYRDDKEQLLHTVSGIFKADQITEGKITMPNGDYYEGLIKDNHLPDKGTLYFNLNLQPPYQPQFPNSIQYHKCVRNVGNSFSWTANLGLFSQPVTIIGPSDSAFAIRPEGNTCEIITADQKKYTAEFEKGILIALQDLNGNILHFIQRQEAVWIMQKPETLYVSALDYFGKIQLDTLLMDDEQAIFIKSSLTTDTSSQEIKACGFGCVSAGNITHLSYYLRSNGETIPESHRLTAEQSAGLNVINRRYTYTDADLINTEQLSLAYKGSTHTVNGKTSAHSINEEKNHYYFWRDRKLYHCETKFFNGFATDDEATITIDDITFRGSIRGGVIQGLGSFAHQENHIEGNFITELVAIPLPVSLPLFPPTQSEQSRIYQPVTLTAGAININPGATLNGKAITETALHQLPAFEAFLPAGNVLPQIVFSVDY